MIFVDTSAWVALEDRRDANYTAAIKYKMTSLLIELAYSPRPIYSMKRIP